MKTIYESFAEIADDFTRGESWTHACSKHTEEECLAWQHGVYEFAKWLDEVGVKIIANPEIHDKLWRNTRSYKSDGLRVLPHHVCPKCGVEFEKKEQVNET